jgi:hypothetical protein
VIVDIIAVVKETGEISELLSKATQKPVRASIALC